MKRVIKQLIPPLFLDFFSKIKYTKSPSIHLHKNMDQVFTDIYTKNSWGNNESVSGVGSTITQTKKIIPELEKCFQRLHIQSLLDIPCGDFNWMQHVNLTDINYTGADIVQELVTANVAKYSSSTKKFVTLDLASDNLPQTDLLLVRDAWVHFSYDAIFKSIHNIVNSKSEYLMVTTFTNHLINYDIVTGDWRPLNLEKAPFHFPSPLFTIPEHYDPQYKREAKGKSLGIWKIDDLKNLKCIG